MSNVRWSRDSHPVRVKYVLVQKLWATFQTLRDEIRREWSKSPKKKKTSWHSRKQWIPKSRTLPLLWLALHCWPECFLLGCSGRLGFGFRSRRGLLRFRLQGFEAQDLTVLVALVQGFELVDEGRGAVSFEAFVSEKGIHYQYIS